MVRHVWLFLASCTLVPAFEVGRGSVAAADGPPNVLLICIDDLKPTLGCFGDQHAETPNFDALAQRGVVFHSAYCNQAVCSPSRNSLMTGLRPQTLGIYDLATHFRLAAPDAITLGQHFKKHGYHTQGIGKIYHTAHGNIDDKATWSVPSWKPKAPTYALEESKQSMRTIGRGTKRGPATEAADVPDDAYVDGLVAAEAVKRLEAAARSPDQPFLLAVGFIRPHLPFVSPQRYWDLYDPATLPMPAVLNPPVGAPEYAPTSGRELRNYSDVHGKEIDERMTRRLIHGYYAATSYTDAQLGRVLETLEKTGLAKNTIVVLWGDHGWHLGDHGMWCKHSNYEQAARIPIVISAPDGAQGGNTNALIETVDLYPTLAELAGISLPQQLDGVSLASVVRDPSSKGRDYATHVFPRGERLGRAIRTPRYRIVEWRGLTDDSLAPEYELYDYQVDPQETKNLAAEQPAIVERLRGLLAEQAPAKPSWQERPAAKTR